MMKKHLRVKPSYLFKAYGVLYVAFLGGIIFSSQPILAFSIGYWIFFAVLIFTEHFTSGAYITKKEVVFNNWFITTCIPLKDLVALEKGKFYGIGNPESIILTFRSSSSDTERRLYILPSKYGHGDISEFISRLRLASPEVVVESEIERTYQCKTASK